jgi:hypothetical protein
MLLYNLKAGGSFMLLYTLEEQGGKGPDTSSIRTL